MKHCFTVRNFVHAWKEITGGSEWIQHELWSSSHGIDVRVLVRLKIGTYLWPYLIGHRSEIVNHKEHLADEGDVSIEKKENSPSCSSKSSSPIVLYFRVQKCNMIMEQNNLSMNQPTPTIRNTLEESLPVDTRVPYLYMKLLIMSRTACNNEPISSPKRCALDKVGRVHSIYSVLFPSLAGHVDISCNQTL